MTAVEFRRQLDLLSADYRARLPEKTAELARLWGSLVSGMVPTTSLGDLRRELHTLSGSAKTFGAGYVSELAAAAEVLVEPFCEQGSLPGAAEIAEIARLLDALQRSAADA
ncbi:MAG: Hpt domain-containing protein [Burkholderiales bacterium]|nr:Hpt domain-containing protein [Burkholderiales bacterium]